MGKAFVAKLAKEGARDPEALAAWIGRRKHGKAFGKLAAAGRNKDGDRPQTKGAADRASDPQAAQRARERKTLATIRGELVQRAAARQKAREKLEQRAAAREKAQQSAGGTVGVAQHYTGTKVYGSPDQIERAAQRKDYDSSTTTASGNDHDALLNRTSPAFRQKVQEARKSGRPWIHQVGHDSGGAEIHNLQFVDANGAKQNVTYLERNGAPWKKLTPAQRQARYDQRNP